MIVVKIELCDGTLESKAFINRLLLLCTHVNGLNNNFNVYCSNEGVNFNRKFLRTSHVVGTTLYFICPELQFSQLCLHVLGSQPAGQRSTAPYPHHAACLLRNMWFSFRTWSYSFRFASYIQFKDLQVDNLRSFQKDILYVDSEWKGAGYLCIKSSPKTDHIGS